MKIKVGLYKTRFTLIAILSKILMDYLYVNYISNVWRYQGFFLESNIDKITFSYLMFLILLFILSFYDENKFSHLIVVVLFYTVYLPTGTIYAYMNMSSRFFIYINISFIILAIVMMFFRSDSITRMEIKHEYKNNKVIRCLYMVTIYTLIIMTIQNIGNLNIESVLNFTRVYEVRESVRYGWGMSYLFTWQTKVISPFLIVLNYNRKNWKMVYIVSAIQLWLYILTGHKLVIFTLMVTIGIVWGANKIKNLPIQFTRMGLYVFFISLIEVLILKSSVVIDHVLRRVFYLPSLLSYYYYDFFSNYGFQYWKYSIFGRILGVEREFERLPSYIIGKVYFGNPNNNAVNGYLGSEYMNAGFLGILLATVIIILILIIIDHYVKMYNKELVLATFITPIYTLWNTNIITAFVSGGIVIAILLFVTNKRVNYSEGKTIDDEKRD